MPLELKNGFTCSHRAAASIQQGDSQFAPPNLLVNGDTVRNAETVRLTLVQHDTNKIHLLVVSGITTKNQLFAVVDLNRDGNLGNDSVYYIQPSKTRDDFVCNLPPIRVSGLPLLSPQSKDTLTLFVAPSKSAVKPPWFIDFFEVATYRGKLKTALFKDYYLSGHYQYKDTGYEIRAILPAESYNLYNAPVSLQVPTRHMIWLGVRLTSGNEKEVLMEHTLFRFSRFQGEDAPFFKTGNHYLRFDTIDLPNNKVVITIRDTMPAATDQRNIKDATALSLRTAAQQWVLPAGRPTILHFSGSWCRPCHAALPGFKKLYARYKNRYAFATVLAERNATVAAATYKKERIPWPGFYEQLSCKEKDCLQRRLDVGIFPTYCIVSEKGDVLKQVNSVEELGAALQSMAAEVRLKAGLPQQ